MRPSKDCNIILVYIWGYVNMDKIKIKNKRLSKYLYSLGFPRESFYLNNIEYWLFEESDDLKESLDFYFYMRNKTRIYS